MQRLQTFIDILTRGRKFHICIHDISGLLKTYERDLPFEYRIHSKNFCNIAKSTEEGLDFCMNAKNRANSKSATEATPFFGHCPWGIFEVAYPVIKDKAVQAIIYVGNFITNEEETKKKIIKTSASLNMSPEPFFKLLDQCEKTPDSTEALQIAEIVKDYILSLPDTDSNHSDNIHWAVRNIKNYAKEYYSKKISLKSISKLYFINEKYIGRLFKKQTGMSFCQYLNGIRLKQAEELLLSTENHIIDIAIKCGFENVSYFNRIFKEKYGVTPLTFRRNRK